MPVVADPSYVMKQEKNKRVEDLSKGVLIMIR